MYLFLREGIHRSSKGFVAQNRGVRPSRARSPRVTHFRLSQFSPTMDQGLPGVTGEGGRRSPLRGVMQGTRHTSGRLAGLTTGAGSSRGKDLGSKKSSWTSAQGEISTLGLRGVGERPREGLELTAGAGGRRGQGWKAAGAAGFRGAGDGS